MRHTLFHLYQFSVYIKNIRSYGFQCIILRISHLQFSTTHKITLSSWHFKCCWFVLASSSSSSSVFFNSSLKRNSWRCWYWCWWRWRRQRQPWWWCSCHVFVFSFIQKKNIYINSNKYIHNQKPIHRCINDKNKTHHTHTHTHRMEGAQHSFSPIQYGPYSLISIRLHM